VRDRLPQSIWCHLDGRGHKYICRPLACTRYTSIAQPPVLTSVSIVPGLFLNPEAMFSFHKSDASRSRQSSVDSEATGATTFTSGSDPCLDQGSMSSSHVGAHSPEQHHRGYSARRSSVFNLRSRSNTATSMTPSLLSLSHPDMAEHDASPPGYWQAGSKSQKESTGSRRSLFRGRRGKRLSETTMGGDAYEGDANEKRASVIRRGRKGNNLSEEGKNRFPLITRCRH
jgi:hypothetical protein